MPRKWRYRITSVVGTAALTALAVWIANLPSVQAAFSRVPYFGRPAPVVLANGELTFAVSTTLVATLAAMWPVFKPRPRRILNTILLTQKRVVFAMFVLAALGYYNYTYRLPRSTLMVTTGILLFVLPALTVSIRRRPSSQSRAIIVGDDPEAMADILEATEMPVIGYVSPPSSEITGGRRETATPEISDGGTIRSGLDDLPNLGGLSRLDEVFVKHNVDTAVLAFAETDRSEFFGALAECYDHGIAAKVHRNHADHVLTKSTAGSDLVEVDLEPWDWQDYVAKRVFDVTFSTLGLLVLSPLMILVAVAIVIDDPGPVLYRQERTAEFGETFTVYKFRTMTTGEEDSVPTEDDENSRITRVGCLLRKTHLDELPQLFTILFGKMSVVGPRAAWTDEEMHLEEVTTNWRQRWFVKPGLTGLAQINGVSSTDPHEKLRYDIEYIRRQSFWFDIRIVIRQLWLVGADAVELVLGSADDVE